MVGLSRPFHSPQSCLAAVLQPRRSRNSSGLGCAPFARHYLGYHCCFLFLPVLRCFSSRGSPPYSVWVTVRQTAGLPHSEIRGSQVACTSPRLIAACRVLRRLPEPRHPPYALSYFRRAHAGTLSGAARHLPSAHRTSRADGPRFFSYINILFVDSLASSSTSPRTCAASRIHSSMRRNLSLLFQHVKDPWRKACHHANMRPSWRITDSNR